MRQFVPMNDDLLYRSDLSSGALVPYRCGLPCWHQLQEESQAADVDVDTSVSNGKNLRDSEAVRA